MISINGVSKRYRRRVVALDNVSLTLPNKGLISLVGENGCGKTTLLNVLSTMDKPTSGTIHYNQFQYCRRSYRYLRNQIISYIQQENVFSDYLSVYDNIRIEGVDKDQITSEFKRFNIEDKIDSKASTLSGGQRQKSSVIRGTLKESSILLVDEPTSSMDEKMEGITFQILKEISKNKLVVVVSHNMQLIEEYSDLIIHMENGRITDIMNTTVRKLIIKENVISVPDDHIVVLSDWETIRNVLRQKKQVVLETHKETGKNKCGFDYSFSEQGCIRKKRNSTKIVGHIALKSLLDSLVRIILSSVFVALLIVLTGVSLCLANVNVSKFEYDMFKQNGYEYVNLSKNQSVDALGRENNRKGFSWEDYVAFQKEHGLISVMLSDFEWVSLGFNYDEVYSSFVAGYAIVNDRSQCPLMLGAFPTDNQIMITDYLADNFILNGIYASYDEIVENGMVLNGYSFRVSGIVDSGYKTLLTQMDSTSFKDSEAYLYWCYMVDNAFSRLYTIYPVLDTNYRICMIPIYNGQFFADIQVRKDLPNSTTSQDNSVFVNPILFENLDGSETIKTSNGAYKIAGVVEDEELNPVIYVTLNQYNDWLHNPFAFSSFNLTIDDYKVYKYIRNYDVQHNTPLSSTINKAIDAVQIIDMYLKPILFVCTLCTVVLSSAVWFDLASKDRFALYSLVTNGFSGFQIWFFNIIKLAVKLLVELTLSVAFFFVVASGINSILSSISSSEMILIPHSPNMVFKSFLPYTIIMLIIVAHSSIRTRFSMPIKLFMKSKNS